MRLFARILQILKTRKSSWSSESGISFLACVIPSCGNPLEELSKIQMG